MALIMPHLMGGDYASAIEVGRRAIELNPWFSSAYKGYLAALGHMDRRRTQPRVLRRLLAGTWFLSRAGDTPLAAGSARGYRSLCRGFAPSRVAE